jgi:hypothetical protein
MGRSSSLALLPEAKPHPIQETGHWLPETHFEHVLPLVRNALSRALN